MEDPALAATYVVYFRIAERVAISLIVILLGLVVSVAFWRSLQRIDFQLSREKLSGGGTVVLATPLFALIALIGFAWVSFSNPVAVTAPGRIPVASQTAVDPEAGAAQPLANAGPVSFVGSTAAAAQQQGDVEFRRNAARELVRSLNCVAESAGQLAPREVDALARLRLAVMEPVWDPSWGDFAAFRAWAEARTDAEPNAAAKRFFHEVAPACR